MIEDGSAVRGSWRRVVAAAGLLESSGAVRETIFAQMTGLAMAHDAINLGQGFPDEPGPPEVLETAQRAIRDGLNQYPPGRGTADLREAIAEHQAHWYGLEIDPAHEVIVTAGATEAIAAAVLALTEPGDRLVTFEPYYDSYAAVAALAGVELVTVPLRAPDFEPDLDELTAAVDDRTAVILVNTPHNPTGAVLDRPVLERIVALAQHHDAIIITDEVYEHLVFDGIEHVPIATLPGARERTVTIGSGGKTFSTTGWKVGWAIAPRAIAEAVLAVKQFLTFTNAAPFQPAIAAGLRLPEERIRALATQLQAKRDLLREGLRGVGLVPLRSSGTYFVIAEVGADAVRYCLDLPSSRGVAAVPVSAFVRPGRRDAVRSLARFAFCKRLDVLEEAIRRLAAA